MLIVPVFIHLLDGPPAQLGYRHYALLFIEKVISSRDPSFPPSRLL
jgi:hypothetical protein